MWRGWLEHEESLPLRQYDPQPPKGLGHPLLRRSVFSPTLEPKADCRSVLIIPAGPSQGREAPRLWVVGPGLAGDEAGSDSGWLHGRWEEGQKEKGKASINILQGA